MKTKKLIDSCLSHIQDLSRIAVDTETTGLIIRDCDLLSLQIGDFDKQFVLPPEAIFDKRIRKALMEKTIVMHNAKYDLSVMAKYDLRPTKNVSCTFLAEKLVVGTKKYLRCRLLDVMERYFKIEMSKEAVTKLQALGIDHPTFQEYAKLDVKYLLKLDDLQREILAEKNQLNTLKLENRFVPTLAYIETCGFKLNKKKWKEKMLYDRNAINKCLEKIESICDAEDIKIKKLDNTLFGIEEISLVNWDSSKQVIPIFEGLGFDLEVFDRKTKKYKKSVQEKNITRYEKKHDLIGAYIKYKKAQKLDSSYGLNYLSQLKKHDDGRLRTSFQQIMDTGRLSSGAKTVNFQNIPKVDEPEERSRELYERECFEPEEGNVFVTADYMSQESRLLAHFSQDSALVEFYNSGEADLHSYATKMVFREQHPEMDNMNLKEIKQNFKGLRQIMKGFNFALAYGGNANTVSDNLGIPIEDAQKYEKLYYQAFAGLQSYFKKTSETSIARGYIEINPQVQRRVYFRGYSTFENLRKELNLFAGQSMERGFMGISQDFWNKWKKEKANNTFAFTNYLQPKFDKYRKMYSSMRNNSLNYPDRGLM